MAAEFEDAPDSPLPRRMYAGNDLKFHEPLRIGDAAKKEIFVKSVTPKEGRSGQMIFVTYGITVGGVGTLVGIGFGVGICKVIETFGIGMDPDVYYISNLPVKVEGFEVFLVGVAALGLSYLATIYPALLAARLKPVEGLRYE